jgi:glycerophosphoryl diester phosphodiesterase
MMLRSTLAAGCLLSATAFANVDTGVLDIPGAQLGPRPFYLVDELEDGKLKRELERCAARTKRYGTEDFSIGHRGAPLQFPEHTLESYIAAARMGAGILECDVTFTSDAELVCRHAQCDLHTTTNIVATDLASKCTVPPQVDADGNLLNGPAIKCCASDLTLAEFKSLEGKMDAADVSATTIEGYLGGTSRYRTDLYATGGTLLSVAEATALFERLGRKHTPELKGADGGNPAPRFTVDDVFGSQAAYAQALIDELTAAGVDPDDVWAQSFDLDDVLYWIDNAPAFGKQAVFLDGRDVPGLAANPPQPAEFEGLKARGVNIIAPPMPVLLTTENGEIVPSVYAERARAADLDIISWTIERSGPIVDGVPLGGAFYYLTTLDAIANDGDILTTIDVLAQDVEILGLFSDWPATTTFYANCKDIPALRRGSKGQGKGKSKGHDKHHGWGQGVAPWKDVGRGWR